MAEAKDVKLFKQTLVDFAISGANLEGFTRTMNAEGIKLSHLELVGLVSVITQEKDGVEGTKDMLKDEARKLNAEYVFGVGYEVTSWATPAIRSTLILASGDAYRVQERGE